MKSSEVRGFNYYGSWGSSLQELWLHFDYGKLAVEVAQGKIFFPGWNMVRWWLSHEAFMRMPGRFLANFEAGLNVFDHYQIRVIPVLFNRLHDPSLDLGGIYLEQIIPDQSRYGAIKRSFDPEISVERGAVGIEGIMRRYLSEVIGQHRRDSRIYAWDLCNTPFGPYIDDYDSPLLQGEMAWLSWLADFVRRLDAEQPLTISNELDPQALRLTSSLCDLLAFQPYYQHGQPGASQARFEMTVDECLQVANDSGKELLATETVWGSLVDGAHVAIMQYTLQCLKDRGIGWITQSLYHSPVANQHLPSYGPVGVAGYQAFINPDNRLRDGHDAWNRI